jgi:DNA-binding transcriptional regulator PaaX
MGQIERESARRKKRADTTALILGVVQAAGVLSIALVAPKVLTGMKQLGLLPGRRQGEYIRSAQRRLIEQGLLSRADGSLKLTAKGEKRLRSIEMLDYRIPHPRRWDKRWRVLVFDIPERKRLVRARLTAILRSAGFVLLQDSVWVHPYDCEDMLQLIKSDLGVRHEVLYIIADTIENDRHLRDHFGL